MNITEGLRRIARDRPDAPAIICGGAIDGVPDGCVYTCASLDRVVDAIAIRAAGWNLAPGKHVSLLFKRHLPMLLLRLGLARAGVPMCNIPALGDAGARVVLQEADPADDVRTIVADPAWWSEESEFPAPMHAGGDALLVRQATSGSLGEPKVVPMSHAMFAARWNPLFTWMPPPREPRTMCTIGPGGGPSLGYLLNTLEAGGTFVVPAHAEGFLSYIERHRVSLLLTNPHGASLIIGMQPAGAAPPPALEQVVLTGARVTTAMARLVAERLCPNVLSSYASTESGLISAGVASALASIDGATGRAHAGVVIEIVDAEGAVLPAGAAGIVRVRAPGQARAYHGDPAMTARVFRDGWVYPGDIGSISMDGMIAVSGRVDDLINLGGSKIAPEIIESVLLRVPGVREAAAFGVSDALGKPVLHAAIVADGAVDLASIEAAFRADPLSVPPSVVLRVPRLPRNEMGKLVRRALVDYVKSMPAPQPERPRT